MRKTLHSREVRGFARTCCEASNLRPGTSNTGRIKESAEVASPGLGRGGKRCAGVIASTWCVSVPVREFVCGSGYDEVGVYVAVGYLYLSPRVQLRESPRACVLCAAGLTCLRDPEDRQCCGLSSHGCGVPSGPVISGGANCC